MAASEPATRYIAVRAPRRAYSFERAPQGPSSFWIWSIPLSWLTSASIVLEVAQSAVFFLWFALACTYLFRCRSRLVVWLVAIALPMHGYAAVAQDLRGPAHYHGAAAQHAHGGVERHFHTHGEDAVEVDDGDRGHEGNVAGTGKNGTPGGFDTQFAAPLRVPVERPPAAVAAGETRATALPFPGRVERPPASAAIL